MPGRRELAKARGADKRFYKVRVITVICRHHITRHPGKSRLEPLRACLKFLDLSTDNEANARDNQSGQVVLVLNPAPVSDCHPER